MVCPLSQNMKQRQMQSGFCLMFGTSQCLGGSGFECKLWNNHSIPYAMVFPYSLMMGKTALPLSWKIISWYFWAVHSQTEKMAKPVKSMSCAPCEKYQEKSRQHIQFLQKLLHCVQLTLGFSIWAFLFGLTSAAKQRGSEEDVHLQNEIIPENMKHCS